MFINSCTPFYNLGLSSGITKIFIRKPCSLQSTHLRAATASPTLWKAVVSPSPLTDPQALGIILLNHLSWVTNTSWANILLWCTSIKLGSFWLYSSIWCVPQLLTISILWSFLNLNLCNWPRDGHTGSAQKLCNTCIVRNKSNIQDAIKLFFLISGKILLLISKNHLTAEKHLLLRWGIQVSGIYHQGRNL